MTDEILYRVENRVAILTINNPNTRNALSWRCQKQFAHHIERIDSDPEIRVVIVTGTGDRAFASGGDLKELSTRELKTSDGERLNRIMGQALEQVVQLRVPVIAAINGDAIGGGCEIVTACDLRLAVSSARFRFAQVQVGLTTGWGGTSRLVRILGAGRATELLLTARYFSADEAYQMGFLHRVFPPTTDLLFETLVLAEKLKALPAQAMSATKRLIRAAMSLPTDKANQIETQLFKEQWLSADHLEALSAFKEKREPKFGEFQE